MRMLVFLLAICLFCLPVLANQEEEEVTPFVYVQQWVDGENFFVMDANSKEILYSYSRDDSFDCPFAYSENQEWLLHGSVGQNELFNLLSYENIELIEGARRPTISADGNYLAYYFVPPNQQGPHGASTSLYLQNLRTGTQEIVDVLWNVEALRFVGNDLLYASIVDREIVFSRWDGILISSVSFERIISDWTSISISPNGQFLAVSYRHNSEGPTNSQYLIDSTTSRVQEIPDGRVIWQPTKAASFALVQASGEINLYDAISGEVESINSEAIHFYYYINWSPDGNYLAVSVHHEGGTFAPANSILLFSMTTGESQKVYGESLSYEWGMEWISASQLIFTYASRLENEARYDIYLYDVVRGSSEQLTFTPDINEQLSCVQ